MGTAELVSPVTTTDGDNGELGGDDGSTDGGRHFLGALHAEADVSIVISDGDESLEAGTLTGTASLFSFLVLGFSSNPRVA